MSKSDADILERVHEFKLMVDRLAPPRISGKELEQAVINAVQAGEDIFIKSSIGWGDVFIDGDTYHVFDKADAYKVGMMVRTNRVTTGELSRQSKRYHELKQLYEENIKPLHDDYIRSRAQVVHGKQVMLNAEASVLSAREAIKSGIDRSDACGAELERALDAIVEYSS